MIEDFPAKLKHNSYQLWGTETEHYLINPHNNPKKFILFTILQARSCTASEQSRGRISTLARSNQSLEANHTPERQWRKTGEMLSAGHKRLRERRS